MWKWLKDTWNYWTGASTGHPSPAHPAPNPVGVEVKTAGHVWSMDPETQIATRMRVFKVPVGTNGAWDYKLQPTDEKRLIPHTSTHKDANGHFVLDPLPTGNVNGVPVFSRRAGHYVATIDAGHGVVKPGDNGKPVYDAGSASPESTGAGRHVTEDVINLHLAQNSAVAFASRGWDTIITRTTNATARQQGDVNYLKQHVLKDGGFGFRIDAANQADVYISLHGDQRIPQPGKTEKDVQGVRIYTDGRIQPGDRSLDFARYMNDATKAGDVVQDGFVRRPNFKMINGERIRGPISMLIEPGAINQPHDAAHMRSVNFWHNFSARLAEKTEEFLFHPKPSLRKPPAQPQYETAASGNGCVVSIPTSLTPGEMARQLREGLERCAHPAPENHTSPRSARPPQPEHPKPAKPVIRDHPARPPEPDHPARRAARPPEPDHPVKHTKKPVEPEPAARPRKSTPIHHDARDTHDHHDRAPQAIPGTRTRTSPVRH